LWADRSAPAIGQRFYRAMVFPAPTNMVFIPPGTFRMGSPTNEVDRFVLEGPQTAVIISRGFWMGKYEVTQGEYVAAMGSNPSNFQGPDLPVEQVTWFDASEYCDRFTQRERAAGHIAINCLYRLPTEAEWEYACRGWTSDRRFSYGDDPGYTNLTNYAWYVDNSGRMSHPVGQKLPNPWGLYDMHGNISEWCQDWFAAYTGGIAVDPQGPGAGTVRVVRGGAWGGNAGRSAYRNDRYYPGLGGNRIGFRVVLAPGQP
jgi:formylglycine-generating enzyme required for sulfatase activity